MTRWALLLAVLGGCFSKPPSPSDRGDAGPGLDAPTAGPFNVIFATSTTTMAPTLGGIAGGDALCAERAQAGGFGGTFKAWLSDTTTNALSRLGTARGWVRPDGRPFVDGASDLMAGRILYPPRLDEHGQDLGAAVVITGTSAQGTDDADCDDYRGRITGGVVTYGLADRGTAGWTQYQAVDCHSLTGHLYCMQVDHNVPVTLSPSSTNRIAFVTAGTWKPGSGIDAADATCGFEAQVAGLAGNFVALLGTSTQPAVMRLVDGAPWQRRDGVVLASTVAKLKAWQLDAPLNQTAGNAYISGANNVWTGMENPSAPGSLTCNNWTSSDMAMSGTVGDATSSTQNGYSTYGLSCNAPAQLYCFQQ